MASNSDFGDVFTENLQFCKGKKCENDIKFGIASSAKFRGNIIESMQNDVEASSN